MTVKYPRHKPYTVDVADCGDRWRLPVRGRVSWTKAQATQAGAWGATSLMKGLGVTRPPGNRWPWTTTDTTSENEWKQKGFDDGERQAYAKLGNHSSFSSTYNRDGGKKDGRSKRARKPTKQDGGSKRARTATKQDAKGKGKGSPGKYSTFSVRPSTIAT